MKIEMGKKYKTKSGLEVRIYQTDHIGIEPVMGAIKQYEGWEGWCWDENGVDLDPSNNGLTDLVEVLETIKVKRFVNVYDGGDVMIYNEESFAKKHMNKYQAKTVAFPIEFEVPIGYGV